MLQQLFLLIWRHRGGTLLIPLNRLSFNATFWSTVVAPTARIHLRVGERADAWG
jgi:hypothetical protein